MSRESQLRLKLFKSQNEFITLVLTVITIYVMVSSHLSNMKNVERMDALITKYEAKLDKVIASDEANLKAYRTNLKRAMNSLTAEEKELVEKIFAVTELDVSGSH